MATASESERKAGPRNQLLLFPAPFHGHINPMLHLATTLHSRGFSITIFHTHFNAPNPANHPNFTFQPIDDGLSRDQLSAFDMPELVAVLNTNCRGPFHDHVAQMMLERRGDQRVLCLIADVALPFTRDVADKFKIPRVLLRTNGAAATIAQSALQHLGERGYFAVQDGDALVHELPPLRVKDLPLPITMVNPNTFEQLVCDIYCAMSSSSGIIFNTLDGLEPTELMKLRKDLPIPLFPMGPLHKHSTGSTSSSLMQDRGCIAWLDKQAPGSVIYVSLGSIATIEKAQLVEIGWGLANSEQPFLWVLRPGSVHGSERAELPERFEEKASGRGLIVDWAPQIAVLAHPAVGGFWTHNGWNSTMESVGEGVPMLCWPCFWDQKVNARYATHVWKVGLELESEVERGKIERAIRLLMADEEGSEIRERAKVLKKTVELSVKEALPFWH